LNSLSVDQIHPPLYSAELVLVGSGFENITNYLVYQLAGTATERLPGKTALLRQSASHRRAGVGRPRGEALFCLDFSLVRFFSSRKRNERIQLVIHRRLFSRDEIL